MRSLLLLALAALSLPAAAQITASTEAPVRGEPIQLTFDAPVDTFTVTYRPGAVTATSESIATGGLTTVTWTPERAGVVQIGADGATQNLSVRFTRAPIPGLLVMLVAGLVLFGGAAGAMSLMLRGDSLPDEPRFDS
jgi:hypothetical protein